MSKKFIYRFAPVSFNLINWISMLSFLLSFNLGYIFRLFIDSSILPPINHFNIILGGFGMAFAIMMSSSSSLRKNDETFHAPSISKLPLFFLGITGVFLAMDGVGIFSSVNKSLTQTGYLDFITKAHFCLLLFAIIGAIFLWTSFEVGNDGIVVVNGKIYYPGEKYILIPLFYYQGVFLSDKITVSDLKFFLACKDAMNMKVSAESDIAIDFTIAKNNDLRSLSYIEFEVDARRWVGESIIELSVGKTYGELLSNNEEKNKVICGLPCKWTGKIRLTNI